MKVMLLCHIVFRVFWKSAKAHLGHQLDEIRITIETQLSVHLYGCFHKGLRHMYRRETHPECGQLRSSTSEDEVN